MKIIRWLKNLIDDIFAPENFSDNLDHEYTQKNTERYLKSKEGD